jgi:signal transduction histidine kinase
VTSIRTRLALAVVGCTAGAVFVAAVAVGVTTRAMLFRSLDDRLRARLSFPWSVPRNAPGEQHETPPAAPPASGGANPSAASPASPFSQWSSRWPWYEVHDGADESELSRSPSLPANESLADHSIRPGDPIGSITLSDGRPARLLAATVDAVVRPPFRWRGPDRPHDRSRRSDRPGDHPTAPESEGEGDREGDRAARARDADERPTERSSEIEHRKIDVYLAVDASEVTDELNRLVWILVAVWSGATALSWIVVLWLRRTVLEPVASLSRTIQDLSPTNLAARVPAHEAPLELQSVVGRLNELLARVEAAFGRERSTIANLAHELRNPLSALRAKLEFGLLESPESQHRALESGVSLARRMQSMINGLLTLTRIEAGQERPASRRIDVVPLLREAWSTVDPFARTRDMRVEWRIPDALELESSPTHLALVFANLLDNAVSHGAAGSTVVVELRRDGERLRLRFTNSFESLTRKGSGAPEGKAPGGSIEPLWRRDPARSGDDHSGLGLSLCDRVVRLLGGELRVRQTGSDFEVEIELWNRGPDAAGDAPVQW